jgi:two-component system chemotaxis response regulator CheY
MSGYRFDRLKILVVDDNAHMRKLVTTILQAFGVVQIYEADNGQRAWTVVRESNPDVIIADWVMDGMSGIELVQQSPVAQSLRAGDHADRPHLARPCDAGPRCRRQ